MEALLTLLSKEVKVFSGSAIHTSQKTRRLVPEVFESVDMVSGASKNFSE
jgi:hypothetical protein